MKNLFNFLAFGTIMMVLFIPLLSLAQTPGQIPGGTPGQPATGPINIVNPFKCPSGQANCTIKDLIVTIVSSILIPVGAVVAVVMIMYAGFLYVTAGGNETQIKNAHQALLYAVIGAAILLGAWAISEAISNTIDTLRRP